MILLILLIFLIVISYTYWGGAIRQNAESFGDRQRKYKEYFPGETSVPPEMLYTGTQTEILRQNPGAQLTDRARSLPDRELLNEYFSDPNKVVVR